MGFQTEDMKNPLGYKISRQNSELRKVLISSRRFLEAAEQFGPRVELDLRMRNVQTQLYFKMRLT